MQNIAFLSGIYPTRMGLCDGRVERPEFTRSGVNKEVCMHVNEFIHVASKNNKLLVSGGQWRRYTRTRQVK